MPYSGDPTTSGLDAVRFWAQDTGATGLLSDAEVDYLITFSGLEAESSPLDIAALAADRIAAKYAGEVSISADGVNYSGDQLQQKYTALGKELRRSAGQLRAEGAIPFVGGAGRNFGVGMHDNPGGQYQGEQSSGDDLLQRGIDDTTGRF